MWKKKEENKREKWILGEINGKNLHLFLMDFGCVDTTGLIRPKVIANV